MTLLNIDTENKINLQTPTLIGRSIAVLGITGSGKTNTAAVLIEELLSNGFPLTIVDIEGEYWGLKEDYEILVAGRSKNVDIEVNLEQASHLAEFSVLKEIPIILDLSEFLQSEISEFLLAYFNRLWEVCSEVRQPYEVILEEAHEFIPQGTRSPLKEVLTRIALRGRKRGLGMTMISQRSAKVEKDVLTQASLMFLHRVIHPTDLKVYQDLIPLPPRQVDDMVGSLHLGQAILLFNNLVQITNIRSRHTFHVGATPSLNGTSLPKLRKIDGTLISELKQLILSIKEPTKELAVDTTKIDLKVKELERVIIEKDKEIKNLISQITLLKSENKVGNGPRKNGKIQHTANLVTIEPKIENRKITHYKQEKGSNVTKYLSENNVILAPSEELKLASLVLRIKKLPKLHRSILKVLTEHESTSMDVSTIATWLGVSDNNVRSHPPLPLIKMGLITRRRGSRGYRYTSTFTTFLKDYISEIEPKLLFRLFFL